MNESGFILINKPEGITSSDLVLKVKRLKKLKKIGHTGTLDKFACGLMILPYGNYTAFSSYFLGQDKLYEAFFRFGKSTDSGDRDGEVLESWEESRVLEFFSQKRDLIQEKIQSIVSWKTQNAPLVSALKVRGKRQAELFRKKIETEAKTRSIEISDLEILELSPSGVRLSLRVSSGTYIRKIAMDLSEILGLPIYVSYLCRKEIGLWTLENAGNPEKLEGSEKCFLGVDIVRIPRIQISPEEAKTVRYGKYLPIPKDCPEEFLYFQEDQLIAWCEKKSDSNYIYKKVFVGTGPHT